MANPIVSFFVKSYGRCFHSVGRAVPGVLYTGIEKVLVHGVNFVQGVVLARLLCPEDFGLTAMLGVFLGLGGTLADSGLGTALVISRGKDLARVERQVLAWNVGLAAAICALLAIAAPWIARWYGKPILAPMMWVMAPGLVINAASVVATARLVREEKFGCMAWANGLSAVAAALVAIVLAWRGFGVWSIVWMGIAAAVVRTALAWEFASPASIAGQASDDGFRGMLNYGWKLTLSGIVHTVYMESYNLIIGKMWSPAAVGLFARGNRWARLPADVVNDSVGRVALPRLAKGSGCLRLTVVNAVLLWPALGVLWIFAPAIVGLVLGPKWLDYVPYMRILICGQFFTAVGNIALQHLRASGRSADVLKTDAWKKPVGLVALACGIPFGVAGLCWAKVVGDLAEAVADVVYAYWGRATRGDVDLVYSWYSGNIPAGVDKCRASDNGELRASIAGADRFAPWFRKIFVLVNDDAVVPDWLAAHPKVRIVRLSEFIPRDVLPLGNSASIEMWLHRVPDLCERFVYANDDMFLGRPVTPRDFFDRRGRMICRYSGYGSVMDESKRTYDAMLLHSWRLLKDPFRLYPHHNMDGYLKRVIEDFWKAYPEEALRSASFRRRVPDQLQRDVFSRYAVMTGRGVTRVCGRRVRLRKFLGLMPYESLYFQLSDDPLGWLREDRPKFFCLNDTEACSDADRAKVREILEEYYAS